MSLHSQRHGTMFVHAGSLVRWRNQPITARSMSRSQRTIEPRHERVGEKTAIRFVFRACHRASAHLLGAGASAEQADLTKSGSRGCRKAHGDVDSAASPIPPELCISASSHQLQDVSPARPVCRFVSRTMSETSRSIFTALPIAARRGRPGPIGSVSKITPPVRYRAARSVITTASAVVVHAPAQIRLNERWRRREPRRFFVRALSLSAKPNQRAPRKISKALSGGGSSGQRCRGKGWGWGSRCATLLMRGPSTTIVRRLF